ncbi:stearoyl-CoA desaturase 5-like isoform X1 [Montipora foliosa]|uniref:stearoyl-CoA desaturase 5-like isoform X1 n=2 Tax=Montipora foliosa TaxID=591990 RepID=UPI0035F1EBA0
MGKKDRSYTRRKMHELRYIQTRKFLNSKEKMSETEAIQSEKNTSAVDSRKRPEQQIVWPNVAYMGTLHLMALYAIYLMPSANPRTWLWTWLCYFCGGIGITCGAHRLWAHRSYKATWPFRLLLMLFNSMASQNSIFEWTRDHRAHHKYSETDADPHNAKRGFFFSHVGWLLMKKHPDVITKGKQCDLSDLYEDKIVMFQKRYYKLFSYFFNVVFPVFVPWYFWEESLFNAFIICFGFRYAITLNGIWNINSLSHLWGYKPYDKTINPTQNFIAILTSGGEGFHNFHHTFPQDYAASELGLRINTSKWFIDLAALLGLAFDLKTVSKDVILKRKMRTGDLASNQ